MKSKILFLIAITVSALAFGFSYGDGNKSVSLDGRWKLVDTRISDLTDYYQGLAKKEIGEIALIRSGVIEVKLLDRIFKCEIIAPPNLTLKEKSDIFNQQDQGSLKLKDFSFSKYLFVFKTKKIETNYALYNIVVDESKNKMILGSDGGYFLFVREKNKGSK